jgi:hypothetical protein
VKLILARQLEQDTPQEEEGNTGVSHISQEEEIGGGKGQEGGRRKQAA